MGWSTAIPSVNTYWEIVSALESAASEPTHAEVLRTLAEAELTTTRYLLVFLDLDGLQFVRDCLRSPGLLGVCDEGPLAET